MVTKLVTDISRYLTIWTIEKEKEKEGEKDTEKEKEKEKGGKRGLGMMDVVLQTDTGIFRVEQLHEFFSAMG